MILGQSVGAPPAPPFRAERRAMGSPLRLQLHGADRRVFETAWQRVSDEFDEAEAAMSRFRSESELTKLNRTAGSGTAVEVSRRLYRALAAADRAWRATSGRFDPRVLRDLERLGYRGAALPNAGRTPIAPGRSMVGGDLDRGRPHWLERDPRRRTVELAAPVDLGGIGKGLTLRWAWRLLGIGRSDATGALLEAGGDLVCGGPTLEGGPWMVAVDDPARAGQPVAVMALEGGAACTSSLGVHRWTGPDGRFVHHLIDPTTGEPGGEGLASVTVSGRDPAWAEVWSKTLFLAGRRHIGELARSRGLAAWWVTSEGELGMTPAARLLTVWTA